MGGGAAGKQAWPGCTALAVLLHHNTMLVANAGLCLMPSTFPGSHHLHAMRAWTLCFAGKASLYA